MNEFRGNLGNYKIVKTDDNTETLWSEYFDENCHNISGAKEETYHNYIFGCELDHYDEKLKMINIFDVGFGPGLGLFYLNEYFTKQKRDQIINYFSIEIDEVLVKWAIENTFNHCSYEIKSKDRLVWYELNFEKIKAIIYIGDGRETINQAYNYSLIPPLHAIFQDPFSPKKNPTLWTVEWFHLLSKLSSEKVVMSTYSSSISIRKSMLEAGWKISNHKGFGQKKTMTKARLTGDVSEELLKELSRSPTNSLKD